MNRLEIFINSELAEMIKVENFVQHFCTVFDLPSELHGRVTLSVQEAVNNAILHGNMMESSKLVTLIAEKTKDLLKVTVMDEGSGFDYSKIPDPTLPDAMFDFSGRGLYVMKTLSDQLIFENNGASVALLFML